MSDLPQISEAEFEVMKIVWKYAPISTNDITDKLLQLVVCNNLSVISLVLIGACFHTIFITSNSASEICGKSLISNPSLNLTAVIKIL